MSLNFEERKAVVTYRIEKAVRTIDQAKSNIPMKYWELVANRMYYAAYYAVSALLIADQHTAKTHEGIIRIFGLEYVKKERVPVEMGKLYNKLFTLRLTGDYNDHYGLEEQDVLPLLQPTIDLIDMVSRLAEKVLEMPSDSK